MRNSERDDARNIRAPSFSTTSMLPDKSRNDRGNSPTGSCARLSENISRAPGAKPGDAVPLCAFAAGNNQPNETIMTGKAARRSTPSMSPHDSNTAKVFIAIGGDLARSAREPSGTGANRDVPQRRTTRRAG